MRRFLIAVSMAALATVAAPAWSQPAETPAHIAAALAHDTRPAEDRARDEARHAGALMAFAGVQPGDTVVDLIMGGGYFTRLFAVAVGPEGRVIAWQPAEFVAYNPRYGEQQAAVVAAHDNVEALGSSISALELPAGSVDLVWTTQNYHDLHLDAFPAETAQQVNAAVFAALRPGGVYLVSDHFAADGSGLSAAEGLHRIDRQAVIDEVTAAGFVLDGESDLLRQPEDARTANVFDETIRGHTDQFVLRFRKPE